ncbi:TolC family protein [Hallella sp.]|uniref:TolC family protein n=1 Tax=Hallella sp. TaxID=2980186 RepID=UPI00307AF52F
MLKRQLLTTVFAVALSVAGTAQTTRQLTISEMFGLLEHANRSIRASQTSVEVAREGVKSARSQRLPDINTRLSASFIGNALLMDRDFSEVHGLHSPHLGNQFVVDAQQTIYAGGAIDAGVRLSELGLEKAELATDLTRQQQRLLVLGQYLDLEKLAHRERVLQSNIELTERLIAHNEERHQQGVALKNDITRYELQMETLRLNLTKLRNQRSVISHQLCNALGIEGDVALEPADDVSAMTFSQDGEAHWQQSAAVNSLQLRLATVDERLSGQQERLARSAMLPKVALVASNDFNGPITFELPPINKNLNVWYVGVGVSYPLSSLFKSNKRVRQAQLETRQATERKAVAQERLNNQMQAAWVAYQQSYVELETQQKSVELARENYEVVNNRYLNQLALVTDMLDASSMRLDAELAEADARINIAYAYYKMKFIAGEL